MKLLESMTCETVIGRWCSLNSTIEWIKKRTDFLKGTWMIVMRVDGDDLIRVQSANLAYGFCLTSQQLSEISLILSPKRAREAGFYLQFNALEESKGKLNL